MREKPCSEETDPRTRQLAQAAELRARNDALRREADELRECSENLRERFETLRASGQFDRRFRLAALNLIEDTVEAERRVDREAAERRRAEKSLIQSEARLKAALVAGRMVTWDWDPRKDQMAVSETIDEVFGLSPGDFIQTRAQVLALVHPEDKARVGELLKNAQENLTGWHCDFRVVRPIDGKVIWLEERAEAVREAATANAVYITGVLWDISDRKRAELALSSSEERLRLLLENARDYAIITLDLTRRVTSWNSGAQAIFGFHPAEIIGQSGDMIFTQQDIAAGTPEREAGNALLKGREQDERWHRRKDGCLFWISGVMSVMRNAGGTAVGFVKIVRDRTEEKRAEELLMRSREELEQALSETNRARQEAEAANRSKDQFLAALSHELRTPLTPVLTSVEALMGRTDLPPRATQALEMIRKNIEIEKQFIDDLLDVTRIAHGKMHLADASLDIHETIRAAIEISLPEINGKAQKLTVELGAQQSLSRGDPARLQQVFWNLLKNASKFTENGGEVGVRSRNERPDEIVIEVWDTGKGIDAARLNDIFEAFRQEDLTIAQRFGGLGLGLAICRAVVTGHGGEITAFSNGTGKGATFTVKLPLRGPTVTAGKT